MAVWKISAKLLPVPFRSVPFRSGFYTFPLERTTATHKQLNHRKCTTGFTAKIMGRVIELATARLHSALGQLACSKERAKY